MTDSFLSGWGMAEGKTNKLIFVCDSYEQAEIVAQNAESRSDMKYVNININKPRYNSNRYLTQLKTIEEYPSWYQAGYFKKQKQG
jgi:hypothetical protein